MKKDPQILILVGAPGSGKSTFAKYFIRTEENWMRLCRDDFRTMHFTYSRLSPREENFITEIMDAAIEVLLGKQCNVLIDATHCRAEYLEHYVKKFNHLADISFKVFEAEPQVLADRCEKRYKETKKFIPAAVQRKYIKELEDLKKTFDFSRRPLNKATMQTLVQDNSLPKAIICDLDGTLAIIDNRDPFNASTCEDDKLNEPVACVLRSFAQNGYDILLVSGRMEKHREPTLRFLEKHNIPYQRLWMRKDKDFRKDAIVKKEIFEKEINGQYFIDFVLDDRNQVVDMWRKELSLPCFQVNYGNF